MFLVGRKFAFKKEIPVYYKLAFLELCGHHLVMNWTHVGVQTSQWATNMNSQMIIAVLHKSHPNIAWFQTSKSLATF